uniref:Uncharacterized protein n=1 Tax=Maylandia zebra TaxID=106582 RepID=A0A3P9B4U5_9CICH
MKCCRMYVNYLQILHLHLRSTARWLNFRHNWVLRKESDPKHASKQILVARWSLTKHDGELSF